MRRDIGRLFEKTCFIDYLPPLTWLNVLAEMTEKLDPPAAVQRTIKERNLFLRLGKTFAFLSGIAGPTTIVRKHKEFESAVRRLPDGVFRARFRAMWISLPVFSDLLRHSRICAPFWGGPSTRHIIGRALLADREQNPGRIEKQNRGGGSARSVVTDTSTRLRKNRPVEVDVVL